MNSEYNCVLENDDFELCGNKDIILIPDINLKSYEIKNITTSTSTYKKEYFNSSIIGLLYRGKVTSTTNLIISDNNNITISISKDSIHPNIYTYITFTSPIEIKNDNLSLNITTDNDSIDVIFIFNIDKMFSVYT